MVLTSLDLHQNKKHFEVRPNEPLNILDGVRALAMMWVVLGHTYIFYFTAEIQNFQSVLDISRQAFYLVAREDCSRSMSSSCWAVSSSPSSC